MGEPAVGTDGVELVKGRARGGRGPWVMRTRASGQGRADAMRVAEQTRATVEALKFHFHGSPVQVTVSCGLTALRDGDSADTVFDRADTALYKAKNSGRNVCVAV